MPSRGALASSSGLITGKNPLELLNSDSAQQAPYEASPNEEQNAKFVSVVLAETEDVWKKIFDEQLHKTYVDPKLEMAEITDRVSKTSGGGKALLFENTGYDFPVLMNAYGSERRMCLALGVKKLDDIDMDVLEKIIKACYDITKKTYPDK